MLTLVTCLVVYHSKNMATDEGMEVLDEEVYLGRFKRDTPGYEYDYIEDYEDVRGNEEPKGSF